MILGKTWKLTLLVAIVGVTFAICSVQPAEAKNLPDPIMGKTVLLTCYSLDGHYLGTSIGCDLGFNTCFPVNCSNVLPPPAP